MLESQKKRLALHAEVASSLYKLDACNIVNISKAAIAYAFHQVVTSDIDLLNETREENLKLLAQTYYYLQELSTHDGEWQISDEELTDAICGR